MRLRMTYLVASAVIEYDNLPNVNQNTSDQKLLQ